jgi:serine protease Do
VSPASTPAPAAASSPTPATDAAAPRGWLGVRIQQVTDDIGESLNINPTRGALVAGVDEKGAAKPAGIEAGDVIVRFDGKDIKEMKDLPSMVASTPVGKEVEIVIIRKGKEESHTAKLGRLEDEKEAAAPAGKEAAPPPLEDFFSEFFRNKIASKLGLSLAPARSRGVEVTAVNPNGTAKDLFNAGDVILSVDVTPVNSPDDVHRALNSAHEAGKRSVLILVKSTSDTRFISVSIVDAPTVNAPASASDQPAPHVEPPPGHPATGRRHGGKGRR